MSRKLEKYRWEEFDADCAKIAAWAKSRHIKNIYGIPRGGLIAAVCLSHLLDLPVVLNRDDISRDTLIIDDIIDKGDTIERLLSAIGEHHHVASLFYNKDAKHAPHFYARERTSWVLFPWETEQTSKYDDTI